MKVLEGIEELNFSGLIEIGVCDEDGDEGQRGIVESPDSTPEITPQARRRPHFLSDCEEVCSSNFTIS